MKGESRRGFHAGRGIVSLHVNRQPGRNLAQLVFGAIDDVFAVLRSTTPAVVFLTFVTKVYSINILSARAAFHRP